jgi:predicted branched-subunit amino acid permease
MLEIIAIWAMTSQIGKVVKAKGHKSGWYQVMTVVFWFGGELIGALIGAAISDGDTCGTYGFAIAGAAAGAGVAYLIARSLPDQTPPQTPQPPQATLPPS